MIRSGALHRRSFRAAAVARAVRRRGLRSRTSRHYYRVALEDGTHLRLAERLPFDREFRVSAWRPVAEAPFRYDTRTWYRLAVGVDGDRIGASIDGRQLLDVKDSALTAGIAGLTANMPARFRRVRVTATTPAAADVAAGSGSARRSSAACARRTPGRGSGRSSTPRGTAPAETSASATSTATAASTC